MKYLYKTATGNVAVEVDEKWEKVLQTFDREESSRQRGVRRHEVSAVGQEDFLENLGNEDPALEKLLGSAQAVLRARVNHTLKNMNPCQAELLQTVYVDKVPQSTLAKQQGVTKGAVNHRVKRAKETFKRVFESLEQEGDAA